MSEKDYKKLYIQLKRELECELRDPCGTIWEHCKKLQDQNDKYRAALERLRDCDWVISLPDRMDAVRNIAKEALA